MLSQLFLRSQSRETRKCETNDSTTYPSPYLPYRDTEHRSSDSDQQGAKVIDFACWSRACLATRRRSNLSRRATRGLRSTPGKCQAPRCAEIAEALAVYRSGEVISRNGVDLARAKRALAKLVRRRISSL
ncbi:hypothetical protein RRG08_047046 [Elysia crispata]|uniref:Uncharacterized protein n=1 Tax=Elysia crispata TaxID=231223 RepID=A0AAE1AWY2_9GAST|nr:hypothetical protein RRG08_047046 [Elysia crispata]